MRFRNKKEVILNHPITKAKGTYIYSLLNDDYIATDGILTWKVELIGDDLILDEWRHQIWTNLILVGHSDEEDHKEDHKEDHTNKQDGEKESDQDDDFETFPDFDD